MTDDFNRRMDIFEEVEKFKRDNPWYEQAQRIIDETNRVLDATKPKYQIMTGSSSLPFKYCKVCNYYYQGQCPTHGG